MHPALTLPVYTLALTLALTLAGCGTKGALYREDQPAAGGTACDETRRARASDVPLLPVHLPAKRST
ncbi:MAG TPA: hypothetical protein DCY89_04875 [Gammaproteobacteria bacterium]|nr:hypothetical protein [Gammaproteobacteria bacterium]